VLRGEHPAQPLAVQAIFCYQKRMKTATPKRKRGRPRVGSTLISVRLPPIDLKRLDDWRKRQADKPGRPEAIRRLIAKAMKK